MHRWFLFFVAVSVTFSCARSNEEQDEQEAATFATDYPEAYPEPINEMKAERGKVLYNAKCSPCHQMDMKNIGPPLRGVTNRRTYAWLMNMILYPDRWVQVDPEAKQLHEEYGRVAMVIPEGITEDQAKAVIEYLRVESASAQP